MKYLILILFTIFIYSCKPVYFAIPTDDFVAVHISECQDFKNYTRFEFNLQAYDIFKNSEKTTLLLSDNTALKSLLFNIPLQDTSYLGTPKGLAAPWYKLESYIQTKHKDSLWAEGDKVLIKSIAGKKTELNNQQAKIYRTFTGSVGPAIGKIRMIYINHTFEVFDDLKTKEEMFDEPPLIILAEMKKNNAKANQIFVHAIIDKGFKNKGTDPIIYEFTKLFGSEILLVKK